MPKRDLVVLALAQGRVANTGKLAVFFAPRLKETGILDDYGDWRDWPARLNTLVPGMQVFVNGVQTGFTVTSTRSSPVYRAVFPRQLTVAAYAFSNRSAQELRSFPGGSLAGQISALYTAAAVEHPAAAPTAAELLALPEGDALFGASTPYRDARAYGEATPGTDAGSVDEPEFHGWLSLVGAYPDLLRRLGLVVDLDISLATPGTDPPTGVRVIANYASVALQTREVNPLTLTTSSFTTVDDPVADRSELDDGWLRCGDAGYAVSQVIPSTAAERLSMVEGGGGLAGLRSAAVMLLRDNQLDHVLARINRQIEIEDLIERTLENDPTVPDIELYAEDLTKGYRFDVLDSTAGLWRSLVQRHALGPYQFPRNPALVITPADDEGLDTFTLSADIVNTHTRGPGFGGFDPELGDFRHPHENYSGGARVPPTIVTWDGWSHAVPRPGGMFDTATGEVVPQPAPAPDTEHEVQLAIAFGVPDATLPRLRFGHTYQFRARAVDLSGTSRAPTTASIQPSAGLSPAEFFGRVERVPAPPVVRRQPRPDPGVLNTPFTIVLYSDYDIADGTVAPAGRVVFPAPTDQYLCELHGLPNGGADDASYALLSARDAGDIADLASVDADTGDLLWAAPLTPDPVVNYLPDPAGLGIAMAGAPGAPSVLTTAWSGAWPDWRSGLLDVRAGSAAAQVRPNATTVFRIFLPKATDVVAQLSCMVDPALLPMFEYFHAMTPEDQALLEPDILNGQHWTFSSPTAIHLVHAVRRPLARPQLFAFTASRTPGATDCTATGDVEVSASSTATLALRGKWTETLDLLTEPGPTIIYRPVDGTDASISASDAQSASVRFALGSTKRALVTIEEAEAVSRFVAYFTEQAAFVWTAPTVVLAVEGLVAGTVTVTATDGTTGREGVDFTVDTVAGSVTRIDGGVFDSTSNVTALFVRPPVSRLSTEEAANSTTTVLVPASVAPPPPLIDEVLPAFTKSEQNSATRLLRHRNGRAVRVWLKRPWGDSGDEERLAVLTSSTVDATRWARDPGSLGTGSAAALDSSNFPRAVQTVAAVDAGPYDVAAHEVMYHADTQRWDTDLEITGDVGYRPWVRLALARYQDVALAGAHLSGLVWPTQLRLGPDRTVIVRKRPSGSLLVSVLGSDHDGIPDDVGVPQPNEFTVYVETRDVAIDDPDLGWTPTGQEVVLTRRRKGAWSKTIALDPGTIAPARLVIRETEAAVQYNQTDLEYVRIAAFVEVVPLPDSWLP